MKMDIVNHFKALEANPYIAFSNIPRSQSQYLTHGYHRYPAKFIPNLASFLITKNSKKGDLVCDPFGGCGTTLVEAKVNGRNSIGIDINPIAGLISKTKITPISPQKLINSATILLSKIEKKKIKKYKIPNQRLAYWFDEETFNSLASIYSCIQEEENPEIKRFFSCAFSNILKNCSRWLMKSIKPTIDKDKIPSNPKEIFRSQLKFMLDRNSEFVSNLKTTNNLNTMTKFYLRDARDTGLESNSIDYILTSPPYVTSYEYADLHQLSLLWFEFVDNWIDFKKKFVGTSVRLEKNKDMRSSIGEVIIKKLNEKNTRVSRNVRTYYEDMEEFLVEAKRILKPNKKITIVIGNTNIKGVDILNAEVAYEQMENLGFSEITVEKRQTSSQSITPYRDAISGRFTSKNNPISKRAYQFEYLLTGYA